MKKLLLILLMLFFNFIAAQEGIYEILNTSINSKFAELGVTYSGNNSVIFASSKKDNSGRRTNNRQLSLELYHGMITENGDIIQTDKFTSEINNKFFESDIAFTPDFKTIYFTWNNFYSALKSKDSAKWKTLYMFKASIDQNFEISNVAPMPFNSKEYSVRSPAVSADGKKLYFVSDMPGGYGELDIYVVDINSDGNYGSPKNLGPSVNTKQTELFPYIDQNNTLYFSSNGHKGIGGLDIFKSEFINGNFQQAVNLPPPFNSKYDDFAFVIDAVNSGYFTSNRAGGKGDVDIYAFKSKEPECLQALTFLALNGLTEQPIDQVSVSLFQNNKLIEKQTVSKGLELKFNIDCKETYKIVAEKENFETSEIIITTDDKNKTETTKTLKLTPIECVQLLSGNITDSKTNLALDQVSVSLFQNNKLVEKQAISKNSNFKFSLNCKETYKIIAEKENFETSEIIITTDDKNKTETTKTLKLTSIECVQLLSGNITDSKTNLPLDQVSVSLFQNNKLVEKQTITKGSSFKFNVNCKETYKIIAEKENFETSEIIITTDDKNKMETTKTLKLTPIECVQLLSGNITDSETNLPIDQVQVSLFQNDKLIEKQTISKGLVYKFNIDCKETYKIVAQKADYETSELTFTTDDKNKSETKKSLKLTPIECVQLLSGNITDSKTNLPIDQVQVSLFQNDKLIEKQTISKGLEFKFNIDCKQTYKIVAEKENYETSELTFTTDEKNKSAIKKSLKLTPIECVQLLSGNITDSKTNLPLDQVSVSLFQNNKLVEKQTVSKGSSFKFNVNCKETYKIIAEKENYETAEITVATDDKNKSAIKKSLKLTPIECVQLLSGNITDSKTTLPLDQVIVSLFQNDKLIEKQTISKGLEFKFNIDCKQTYKIVAERENYEPVELTISTDDKNKAAIKKSLKLTPIECVQLLSGSVTDSETNLPLPNAIVHIYRGKELLAKINLDDNAPFNYKLDCELPYRFTVSLKNYHDLVSNIKTSDKFNEAINLKLEMESSVEFVEVREQKMIKTKTIYFDLNESSIRLDAAIELNKVIAVLRKYPSLKIEIKSHTDSRAAADYNMKLTNDRAKKVIDYIISNGIEPSRVSGRGYGETQLLNNCAKGVKCSEAEHQMNRRTEFIITDE